MRHQGYDKWLRLIGKWVAIHGKRPCSGEASHRECWVCGTLACGHVGFSAEFYQCTHRLPGVFSRVSLGKRLASFPEDIDRYRDRAVVLEDAYWVCSAECDAAYRLGDGLR